MHRIPFLTVLFAGCCLLSTVPVMLSAQAVDLQIEVEAPVGEVLDGRGRLLLIFARDTTREPRLRIGWPGQSTPVVFGTDIDSWDGSTPLSIDDTRRLTGYKADRLADLTPGSYFLQVLYDQDTLRSYPNADGNRYSRPQAVQVRAGANRFTATLTERIREEPPQSTKYLKYFEVRSELLSEFWGRPMALRAAVLLPSSYYAAGAQRYPLRFQFGGYHTRHTRLERKLERDSSFRAWWFSGEAPQLIHVLLDGEGPYGDPYYVDSANNGPYGSALTQELIPYLEEQLRAVGRPEGRFVDGGSTGGWVSLALQVFYPDYFNGVWSYCADAVDFHHFQLVDIYADDNAYTNPHGYERPSMRTTQGEPVFSIREEIQLERVLGRGDTYATSGGQWGAWNAAYGPRGSDGRPREIWDPATGAVNREVAEAWKAYDLLHVLRSNWGKRGPQLQGKLHIWMGDMDSFYLNNAMRELEAFLQQATAPASDARFHWGQGEGHCWLGISEEELIEQMVDRFQESDR